MNTTFTFFNDESVVVSFYDSFQVSHGSRNVSRETSKESDGSLIYRSLSRSRKHVYNYVRNNDFDYFVTLTFNPAFVDSFDFSACSKLITKYFSFLRRYNPLMSYICVPEMHKSGRFHFHALMRWCDLDLHFSGHHDRKGRTIYNSGNFPYGFSTVILTDNDRCRLATYLSKYITKQFISHVKSRKRYWVSRNLKYPEIVSRETSLNLVLDFFKDNHYTITYEKHSDACSIFDFKGGYLHE